MFQILNMEATEKFRNKNSVEIKFTDLEKYPLNEIQQLYPEYEGAVEFTRLESRSKNLLFHVSMKYGFSWESHYHDCVENILIYKGELLEVYSNEIIRPTKVKIFQKGEIHYVVSKADTIFYVEFENPQE